VSGIQLKVSVARRQPTLESVTASANTAAADNSSASWSSIGLYQSVAANLSQSVSSLGDFTFLTRLKSSRLDLSHVSSLQSKYLLRPEFN